MPSLALIGYPLTHSFSKKYFENKFSQLSLPDWKYDLLSIENLMGLNELINLQKDLIGFNVTIPHKINIIPFCKQLSVEAESIGAVNCVKVSRNRKELFLTGHNTDAYGFEKSLVDWYIPTLNKAIVFGDGGAAKAVIYVLNKLNIGFVQAVRNVKNENQILISNLNKDLFLSQDLIVNCTPLGMLPNTHETLPIKSEWIQSYHHYYDLVYNPSETATMNLFLRHGATVKNGLEMLYLQADKAWKIWTG